MVPRSGGGRRAATQPWTEQALIMQMNVLKTLLQQQQHGHVDLKHLSAQCLLLSKILDSLVANKRTPVWRHELLPIIKQICRHRESPELRAALLILLLSVKNAYRVEWLTSGHPTERDEISTTLKGLFDSFTTVHEGAENSPAQFLQSGGSAATDFREAKAYLDVISSRFYPRLHVNTVFVAVEAKVGYEVLMCDFHVPHMHLQDRVRLYVGQKEHTETSACIITPPQVNFLVNGQQVERRVATGYLDAGAQMPSDVTTLVKVGANVLQVIGEFSVSYCIAVTSSRAIERSARTTELEEYVAPSKAASGADPAEVDDEVVEGASRVSLRCPISHQRLVTPVKASTCRHLQCFDYDSFLEINEKRPAWRCPCCNRLISCPDLRIDRQMEKVLNETDEKVYEVMFYQDGTWVSIAAGGDQSPVESITEGGDKPSDFVDLSDYEEDTGRHQNLDLFQPQQDRKPDAQTLQAINDRNTAAAAAVERPVISVPEFTAVQAPAQSSPGFTGPLTPGTVEMQPGPSPLPAINHNFQVTFAQSHVSPGSRGAPGRSYMPSAQLQQQQPQTGVSSSSAAQGDMRWVRQRQAEQQQATGSSQNVQETRPQWRSTGASQNTAPQTQTVPQFYSNQTMQHVANSLQQRSSQQAHQQHRPANWSTNPPQAPVHQWRSSTSPQTPPATTTTAAEHWRPIQRMRGSITNPSRGLLPQPPRVTAAPQMYGFPTTNPAASFSYYGMDSMPVVSTNPAANVSLYNGSTWVNGADFSSAPLLYNGVQTSDGWVSFDHVNSGAPPH